MTLNGQWIELFRAGDYGEKGSYTAADIDAMIRNFDPATHEPPVVMGHPEHDAPAYGWVSQLRRVGDVLMGMFKDVPQQFEELVKTGRFKKRSVSFYKTDKGPVLRHVGFLGAMPPEVKGLADVKLASFGPGRFEAVQFNEETEMENETEKTFMEALKKFFGIAPGTAMGVTLSEVDQKKAIEAAVTAALGTSNQKFSELEKQFVELKKETEKTRATAATQAQAAFAEKHLARVKASKGWLPAFAVMGLPQIFGELAKLETKISFGEGDKKVEKTPLEVLADFLEGLPKIVPMGELGKSGQQTTGKLVQFNEPGAKSNSVVDPESVLMAEAAQALATKDKISYQEALRRIRASGEWQPAGAAAAGAV